MALQFQEQALLAIAQYLTEKAASFTEGEVEVENRLGSPRELIAQLAKEQGCNLIVMTSHGRKGLDRWLLGSVAEAVLRRSPCPVLLVRPEVVPTAPVFSNVLVPVDGSESSLKVLERIQPFLREGARVTVLQASGIDFREPPVWVSADSVERYFCELEEQLKAIQVAGLDLSYKVVDGEATQAIVAVSQELACDLVAMSTHGRSGLARVLLGSITAKVARHCSLPLLVFPMDPK
jgi:nucleotide-binding universal stress UspA family protein